MGQQCSSVSYTHTTGDVVQLELCGIQGDLIEDTTDYCPDTKCYIAPFSFSGTDVTATIKVTPPSSTVDSDSITPGDSYIHILNSWVAGGDDTAGNTTLSQTANSSTSLPATLTLANTTSYIPFLHDNDPVGGATLQYYRYDFLGNSSLNLSFSILDQNIILGEEFLSDLSLLGAVLDNLYTAFDPPDQSGDGPGNQSCQGLPHYSVNTASLNLVVQDTDFAYKGLGPSVSLTRTWNMNSQTSGAFGKGWNIPYISQIVGRGGATGTATVTKASGQTLLYQYSSQTTQPDGSVVAVFTANKPNVFDKLTGYFSNSGSYFIYQEKDSKLSYRYDMFNSTTSASSYRLTSITDRNGNALSIGYAGATTTAPNRLTDAAGRQTLFQYDSNSRCTSVATPDGLQAIYAYDTNGNLIQSTDLLGTNTTYTYDSDGSITSITVGNKITTFAYVKAGSWKHIASVTDAMGNTKSYSFSVPNTMVTGANGGVATYTNNTDGTTAKVTDPLQNTVSSTYSNGLPTVRTDARGNSTIMQYDARGNLTKYTDAVGNITQYTYDQNDNMLTKTDQLNNVWTYTYDSNSNLISKVSPAGNKTIMTYDATGQMVGLTDPNGNTTTFVHDAFGNLIKTIQPTSATTKYGYDAFGINNLSQTDPNGNTTYYQYDNNRRVTRITHPDGTYRDISYDACTSTGTTDENGNTILYAHDKLLNLTGITDALGATTLMTYDGNSNRTSVTNPLNQTSLMSYDSDDRLTGTANPLGNSVLYGLDSNGNPTKLTDEDQSATSTTFDANNKVLSVTDDSFSEIVYFTWDPMGRLKQKTLARPGNLFTITYDADGRLSSKSYGNPAVSTLTYSYDDAGNLTSSAVSNVGATSCAYTPLNKVDSITYPDGLSAAFTYDPAGNTASMTYPGGLTVIYAYSNRNFIQSVTWETNSIDFTRDAVGNVLSETRSNATQTLYAYDGNNRLTSIDHRKSGATFAKFVYQRDAVGNTVGETRTLPFAETETNASITNSYYGNALFSSSGSVTNSYRYEMDGNLSSITGTRNMTFAYDMENRLVQISDGATTTWLAYDAVGNRVQASNGSQTYNYHYDTSGRLLFETNATGNVKAYYIYAGTKLAAMIYNGAAYFYHFDQTGNTIAVTDSAGNVSNYYEYEPYGAFTAVSENAPNPFTFVGAYGVMHEGNGIYHMKNRHYDSTTERFMQKDPISFTSGQANLYTYVKNNPVGRNDPNGTISQFRCEFPDYGTQNHSPQFQGNSISLGHIMGLGNFSFGAFSVASGIAAVVAALPLELEAAVPMALYGLYKIESGYGRANSVISNSDEYNKPDYNLKDAAGDAIDPTGSKARTATGVSGTIQSELNLLEAGIKQLESGIESMNNLPTPESGP
jgi:RHS repeat-associated protein